MGGRRPSGRDLAAIQADIDAVFGGETLGDMARGLPDPLPDPIAQAFALMDRNSPLAMACAIEIIRRVRIRPQMRYALDQEYRFTSRAMEHGDFIEGIRAAIIDKDRNPRWRHDDWREVPGGDILKMTLPIGAEALTFEREEP